MPPNKTVILGEASESESEEISLDDNESQVYTHDQRTTSHTDDTNNGKPSSAPSQHTSTSTTTHQNQADNQHGKGGIFNPSSLFASASTFAKLVTYSSYSLLTPAASQASAATTSKSSSDSTTGSVDSCKNQLSPLHKTLNAKNQQFYACMAHIRRHPYEKASKDLHTISQRLVGVQKSIQDSYSAVMRLKKQQQNLDTEISTLV